MKKTHRTGAALLVLILTLMTSAARAQGTPFEGGVYAMSNELNGNRIVAYGMNPGGSLSLIGSYDTGGDGAAFDGGEGLDPLISASDSQAQGVSFLFQGAALTGNQLALTDAHFVEVR